MKSRTSGHDISSDYYRKYPSVLKEDLNGIMNGAHRPYDVAVLFAYITMLREDIISMRRRAREYLADELFTEKEPWD